MFKIGEVVKCVDTTTTKGISAYKLLQVGAEYTVLDVADDGCVRVDCGSDFYFAPERFVSVVANSPVLAEAEVLEESYKEAVADVCLGEFQTIIHFTCDKFTTSYNGEVSQEQFDKIMEVLYA